MAELNIAQALVPVLADLMSNELIMVDPLPAEAALVLDIESIDRTPEADTVDEQPATEIVAALQRKFENVSCINPDDVEFADGFGLCYRRYRVEGSLVRNLLEAYGTKP